MLALKINDIKTFMNQLLIGTAFDSFPMTEASVTTFNTFTIDGQINKDFFDTDIQDILAQNGAVYSLWKEIKPFCRNIMRGKLLPLQFRIILQLTPGQLSEVLGIPDSQITDHAIHSLSLNIHYKNKMLLCTTGVSLKSFTLDKNPEQLWDGIVLNFLKQLCVDFEPL
mgnify:FL=1